MVKIKKPTIKKEVAKKTMKFKIIDLRANDKAINWEMKIKSPFGLIEAKCSYVINIKIDDEYFSKKEDEIKQKIKDVEAKPDMFENYKETIQSLQDNMKGIESTKEELSELEIADFNATVTLADFTKDILTLKIPENVIINIINLRHEDKSFVVELK